MWRLSEGKANGGNRGGGGGRGNVGGEIRHHPVSSSGQHSGLFELLSCLLFLIFYALIKKIESLFV